MNEKDANKKIWSPNQHNISKVVVRLLESLNKKELIKRSKHHHPSLMTDMKLEKRR